MSKWIKCSERLPVPEKQVLLYGGKRYSGSMVGFLSEHDEWLIYSCSDTINIYPPKFWMPLPEPPDEA